MAEQSLDRIRQWEERTGGFLNINDRNALRNAGASSGAPL